MKAIACILLQISILTSSLALAQFRAGEHLTNSDEPSIKMTILESTPEGVPTKIGFSKRNVVVSFAAVTASDALIDPELGEVYNVMGPQESTRTCNLSAKLSFKGPIIVIDFDQADVGTEFFRSCDELAALAGEYSK